MFRLSHCLKLMTEASGRESLVFICPGCKTNHSVYIGSKGNGPKWKWNDNKEQPTLSPSIKVTGSDFSEKGRKQYQEWVDEGMHKPAPLFDTIDFVCHSFVEKGKIKFLNDCTHFLAGLTVDLPDWDDERTIKGYDE